MHTAIHLTRQQGLHKQLPRLYGALLVGLTGLLRSLPNGRTGLVTMDDRLRGTTNVVSLAISILLSKLTLSSKPTGPRG